MRSVFFLLILITSTVLFSAGSVIITVEGTASMGDDKSRKETISLAKEDAKNKASQNAATYIQSETTVRDYILEKDLVEAFSQAVVKVLEEISGDWYKDELAGESYKVTLKVEVIPKEYNAQSGKKSEMMNSPSAPLNVKLWTDKDRTEFKKGEKVKLYLKSNKSFFARIVYIQADGTQVQLLPNPYRRENYFKGGVSYTLPSGKDEYQLEVGPPYGNEKIIVYACTEELGNIKTEDAGAVYLVGEKPEDTGIKTRGITIAKKKGPDREGAEFFETEIGIKTFK